MNNAPAARLGLSDREAARQAGVTHKAIAKAKATGRLAVLADGSISPDGIAEWQRNRRSPRGGHHTPDARAAAGNQPAKVPAAPPVAADDDPDLDIVRTLASVVGIVGDMAADVLAESGLPEDRVRALAAAIQARITADVALYADQDIGPPADGGAWSESPLFDRQWPAPGSDWFEPAAG